jgi:repressor LexA
VEVQVLSSACDPWSRPTWRLPSFDAVRRILYPVGEHTFDHERGGAMLTDRQQQIWNYLVEYVDRHGYPPTVREIGEEVGLASPSTVHAHLANLERAGLLRRDPTKPRALELIGRERREPDAVAPSVDAVALPLVGEIAAGGPLLAAENVEEYVPLPRTTKGDFLLRVKGDSMIEAGRRDGDRGIGQRAQDARNGEIVVALVGEDESADEATVKTFYREKSRVRLQPENAALEPIYAKHVQVIGRVVGVFREL